MQAVVKTPHIEISVRGAAIPPKLMDVLKEEYGPELSLVEDDVDDLVDAFETQWYKGVKEKMTPGTYLRIYRENKGLTQLQLGKAPRWSSPAAHFQYGARAQTNQPENGQEAFVAAWRADRKIH